MTYRVVKRKNSSNKFKNWDENNMVNWWYFLASNNKLGLVPSNTSEEFFDLPPHIYFDLCEVSALLFS